MSAEPLSTWRSMRLITGLYLTRHGNRFFKRSSGRTGPVAGDEQAEKLVRRWGWRVRLVILIGLLVPAAGLVTFLSLMVLSRTTDRLWYEHGPVIEVREDTYAKLLALDREIMSLDLDREALRDKLRVRRAKVSYKRLLKELPPDQGVRFKRAAKDLRKTLRADLVQSELATGAPDGEKSLARAMAVVFLVRGPGAFRVMSGPDDEKRISRITAATEWARKSDGAPYARLVDDRWKSNQAMGMGLHKLVAFLMATLLLSLLLQPLGLSLGSVSWDMEWLFTFPVRTRAILVSKVIAYIATQRFYWAPTAVFLSVYLIVGGAGWWGILLGPVFTVGLALMVASIRVLMETALRLRCRLSTLKGMQATFTLLGAVALLFIAAFSFNQRIAGWIAGLTGNLPDAALWAPFGLPGLACEGGARLVAALILLATMTGATVLACLHLSSRMLQPGLLRNPGWHSRASARGPRRRALAFGMAGKEFRLLLRDKNYLAQTVLLPLLFIGYHLLSRQENVENILADPRTGAMFSLMAACYVLAYGARHALAGERQGLWLLYVFPHRLDRLISSKVNLWIGMGMFLSLGFLVITLFRHDLTHPDVIIVLVYALAGVVPFAYLAGGLGVLGTDLRVQESRHQVKGGYTFLFFVLCGLYAALFFDDHHWNKVKAVLILGLVALAVWQEVSARLPYLLDPSVDPPPALHVSDALLVIFAYFALQAACSAFLGGGKLGRGETIAVGTLLAGVFVTTFGVLVLWGQGLGSVAQLLGLSRPDHSGSPGWLRALLAGAAGGSVKVLVAAGYLFVILSIQPLRDALVSQENVLVRMDTLWLAIMSIVLAPVFEEFMFRRLLLPSLESQVGTRYAILGSAFCFALVHPAGGFVPIFVGGLVLGWVYARTRWLPSVILTHAMYNACVLFVFPLLPWPGP